MKIGILSMQRVKNYGSVLQAYSLMKMVENITGEKVYFIDPRYDEFLPANMETTDKDDFQGTGTYRIGKVEKIIKKVKNHFVNNAFDKSILMFQENELRLSDKLDGEKFDLVIEGSDEVFKCTQKVYLHLYGKVDDCNRLITYAASCGSARIDGLSEDAIQVVKKQFENYSAFSVRDKETKKYISNFTDREILYHMDPVLMGNLYSKEHEKVDLKNYMIVYAYPNRIYREEEVSAIKTYAKKRHLKTVAIGGAQQWCDLYIQDSPLRILDYFYYADCVVTDTFHGAVFSIINHCNFSVFIRKTNQGKLQGLLEQLDLQNRIIDENNSMDSIFMKEINYETVDQTLTFEREKTEKYLKEQIEFSR